VIDIVDTPPWCDVSGWPGDIEEDGGLAPAWLATCCWKATCCTALSRCVGSPVSVDWRISTGGSEQSTIDEAVCGVFDPGNKLREG
jgi:hypothetical protein